MQHSNFERIVVRTGAQREGLSITKYVALWEEPAFEVLLWFDGRNWSGDRCAVDQNTPFRVQVPFHFFYRSCGLKLVNSFYHILRGDEDVLDERVFLMVSTA